MRYEREMIAPIKTCLAARWQDGFVFEEFGVGYGVADVVAARTSPAAIRHRRHLGQTAGLLQRAQVQVIRLLGEMHSARFDELVEHTGVSPKRLRYEILRFLQGENYIEEVDDDTFQLCGGYRPVAREIWAVEAKIKNWFEGFCQARRYQHFAHRVYLAIFAQHQNRVRNEILREHNVGLIAVTAGEARIVFHPRRQTPRSEDLFLLSNEWIWKQIHAPA
jgi:hypothetical protein